MGGFSRSITRSVIHDDDFTEDVIGLEDVENFLNNSSNGEMLVERVCDLSARRRDARCKPE